ncbi:MAG TPA: hypothetical protein VJS44_08365 [Pyrinomonadaceae bacterium]|nr:hypothetical protein [Pyrinomonadaceae bacterium]
MDYTVNSDTAFEGIKRDSYPTISATITHAGPLFLEALRRVFETGQWERLPDSEMQIGALTVPKSPFVMYRSDNPPPDDWYEEIEERGEK